MTKTYRIMLVAGEASGDALGADLITRMCVNKPEMLASCHLEGMAGPLMREAGVKALVKSEAMAVMGFVAVCARMPTIVWAASILKRRLKRAAPDLLVLIDYPGFNIRLARFAKALGIRVLYYVSPKVWVWKKHRLDLLAKCVDHMAVLFAFEKPLYQAKKIPVSYVGHYLGDHLASFVQQHPVSGSPWRMRIALLPGSRLTEIRSTLPLLLQIASQIHELYPQINFVLTEAPGIEHDVYTDFFENANDLPMIRSRGDHRMHLKDCDLALACSGTVTYELGVLGIPAIVIYRFAALSAWIARRFIKNQYASLVNCLSGHMVNDELIQEAMTFENLLEATLCHVENPKYYQHKIDALRAFQASLKVDRDNIGEVVWRELALVGQKDTMLRPAN